MPRRALRTAILRLSALAVQGASFACCAGPTESVEEASEALTPIPFRDPSTTLTAAPRPTAEDVAQASAEVERLLREHLPKWKVYLSGQDYYFGTARGDWGVKHFYSHPIDLDRACALVLVPEDGETRPETWLYLSYQRYWLHGASYLTDELKLSLFDVLGILLALEDTDGQVPPISSLDPTQSGDRFRYEDGPYGPLPVPPPDWISDNHTWTGGPPSNGARPAPSPQPPTNTSPPRSKDWHTWPVTPPKPTGPAFESPPRHTGPPFESFDRIRPDEKPVGKYPGWDQPHPGEWWEKFRCGGQVYEGYRSDCPDYQPKPLGERWTKPFDEVARDVANNAHHTMELIRTDLSCMTACLIAVNIPTILSTACFAAASLSAVPNPYVKAWAVLCRIFRFYKDPTFVVGAGASTALGPRWCENDFCAPPSGKAKLEKP